MPARRRRTRDAGVPGGPPRAGGASELKWILVVVAKAILYYGIDVPNLGLTFRAGCTEDREIVLLCGGNGSNRTGFPRRRAPRMARRTDGGRFFLPLMHRGSGIECLPPGNGGQEAGHAGTMVGIRDDTAARTRILETPATPASLIRPDPRSALRSSASTDRISASNASNAKPGNVLLS